MAASPSRKRVFRHLRIALVLLSVGIFAFFTVCLVLPLRIDPMQESRVFCDRSGQEIGEIPTAGKIRHRSIGIDQIPDFYKRLVIHWEDRSFSSNLGISISGLFRSAVNNLFRLGPTQGASTLSVQLVRNSLWLNEDRTFSRKILEFLYAVKLNLVTSKDTIFELYANRIYFGRLNYGLRSAALYYFGKEPHNLTKSEILALFVIQKNSSRYDPLDHHDAFVSRFRRVADILRGDGFLTDREHADVVSEKIVMHQGNEAPLPYVVDFYRAISEGRYGFIDAKLPTDRASIRTTIDAGLTKKIEEIGNNAVYELAWKNVGDYGVLIIDRQSKELRVMIGGKDYHSKEGQVNSTVSLRQPGSTMKPFTYLLAFVANGLDPDDTILDLPVLYKTKEGYSYEPKNYSTRFEGEVSLGRALAESMNVPAVKLAEKVGVKRLLDFLHQLGISSLNRDADHYGLALTLGDGEVTLYELLRAYTIFPYDGEYCDPKILKDVDPVCRKVVEKHFTDKINKILTSRYLKLGGYPINSALDFPDIDVFFKTGTSRNFRDNWTVGYTRRYIIGVWVGNKDASNMKGVSGATGAGEIFGKIVRFLEPPGKKEDSSSVRPNSQPYLEITSPLSGETYMMDTYLSADKQMIKLGFKTNRDYSRYEWKADGNVITGDFFGLSEGRHVIKLTLFDGTTTVASSESTVEVRPSGKEEGD